MEKENPGERRIAPAGVSCGRRLTIARDFLDDGGRERVRGRTRDLTVEVLRRQAGGQLLIVVDDPRERKLRPVDRVVVVEFEDLTRRAFLDFRAVRQEQNIRDRAG